MCWTIVLLLILMTLGCLSGEDKTKVTVSCLGHQKAFGSSCYEFVLLQHTFSSAQALCEQRGGHLAFIPDEETQYFFQRHVDPKKDMWFGVAPSAFPILPFSSTVEGPLSWLDDSPIIYSNWVSSPQAGASCGHLLRDSGFQWEATKDCNKKLHFICQFESGRSIVCGGRNTTLQCGSGQVLMLDGGFHGRRSMHYCRSTLSTPTTPTQHQCGWVDVGEALTAHCQGRQVCHITELVKSFGEPCPEIGSYLSVDYHCKEGLALSVSTVSAVYDDVTIMVKWLLDLPRGNLGCKLSTGDGHVIHLHVLEGLESTAVYKYTHPNTFIVSVECTSSRTRTTAQKIITIQEPITEFGHIRCFAGKLSFHATDCKALEGEPFQIQMEVKAGANVTYRIHKDKMLLSGLSVVRGTASHNITVTPEKAQQLGPGCHQLTLQASNMVTFPEASADLQMCVLEKVAGLQASVLTEQPDCQDSASITIDVSLERGTPVLLLFSLKGDHRSFSETRQMNTRKKTFHIVNPIEGSVRVKLRAWNIFSSLEVDVEMFTSCGKDSLVELNGRNFLRFYERPRNEHIRVVRSPQKAIVTTSGSMSSKTLQFKLSIKDEHKLHTHDRRYEWACTQPCKCQGQYKERVHIVKGHCIPEPFKYNKYHFNEIHTKNGHVKEIASVCITFTPQAEAPSWLSLTCTQGCDPVEDNTDAKIKMACEGKAQCPQVVWHIEDPRKKQDWPKETESCYKHAKTRPLIQTRHSGTEYTVSHSNLKKAEKHDLTVVVTYEEGEYFYKKYIIKTKSSEGGASPSSSSPSSSSTSSTDSNADNGSSEVKTTTSGPAITTPRPIIPPAKTTTAAASAKPPTPALTTKTTTLKTTTNSAITTKAANPATTTRTTKTATPKTTTNSAITTKATNPATTTRTTKTATPKMTTNSAITTKATNPATTTRTTKTATPKTTTNSAITTKATNPGTTTSKSTTNSAITTKATNTAISTKTTKTAITTNNAPTTVASMSSNTPTMSPTTNSASSKNPANTAITTLTTNTATTTPMTNSAITTNSATPSVPITTSDTATTAMTTMTSNTATTGDTSSPVTNSLHSLQCSISPRSGTILDAFTITCNTEIPCANCRYCFKTQEGKHLQCTEDNEVKSIFLPLGDSESNYNVVIKATAKNVSFVASTTIKTQVVDYTAPSGSSGDALSATVENVVAQLKKQGLLSGETVGQIFDSVSNKLNSQSDELKKAERQKLREQMLAIMTDTVKEAPSNNPQEVQVMARGLTALSKNGTELSSSAQEEASQLFAHLSSSLLHMDMSKTEENKEEIHTAASTIVEGAGNILHFSINKNTSDTLLVTLDNTLSALLALKDANEGPTIITQAHISVFANRVTPSSLHTETMNIPNCSCTSFSLPVLPSDIFPSDEPVDVRMLSLDKNPFSWNEKGNISGLIGSLSLTTIDGSKIPVEDLSDNVEIFLPRPVGEQVNTSVLDLGNYSTTVIDVPSADTTLVLKMVPSKDPLPFKVFLGYMDYPTDTNHVAMTEMPHQGTTKEERYTWLLDPDTLKGNTGVHYLVVRPIVGPGIKSINATLSITSITSECKFWDESKLDWSNYGCKVGVQTTHLVTQCLCNHLSFFGSSFFVTPNLVDPSRTAELFATFAENPVVVCFIGALFVVYFLAVIWARRKDIQDTAKVKVTVLEDNDPLDEYRYLLSVCTGHRRGASTSSQVAITLMGAEGNSEPYHLTDPKKCVFERGAVDMFLLTTPFSLGDLQGIRLWHNNSGSHPDWYVCNVMVQDLQTEQKWHFLCNSWLAIDMGDCSLDKVFPVSTEMELKRFSNLFFMKTTKDFSDGHLWYSVISRPPSSTFTCVQRVSCCFSLLLCTMLTSVMFYGIPTDPSEQTMDLGQFEFTWQQFMIGVQSSLIMFPVNILIVTIFRITRPRKTSCCKRKAVKPVEQLSFSQDANTNMNVTLDTVIKDITRIALSLSKTAKSNIPCKESEFGPGEVDINAVLSVVDDFIKQNNKTSDIPQSKTQSSHNLIQPQQTEGSASLHRGPSEKGIQKKSNKTQYLYRQLCHIDKALTLLGPSGFPNPHSYSQALQQVQGMKASLEDQLLESSCVDRDEPTQKKYKSHSLKRPH